LKHDGNGQPQLNVSNISSIESKSEKARGDTTPKKLEQVDGPTCGDEADSMLEIEVDSSDLSMENINDEIKANSGRTARPGSLVNSTSSSHYVPAFFLSRFNRN